MEIGDGCGEFLNISYADDEKLYIPMDGLAYIQKYTGSGGVPPILNKLGSVSWSRQKNKIKESIREMAEDLLKLYASREVAVGTSYSTNPILMQEFSDSFGFEETEDQLKAIDETMEDLESSKTMDRLICGDVGYGKTSGMFSEGILKQFPNLVKEDEKRLNNISIRENFLTRIFVLAYLRESLQFKQIEKLIYFHSKNILLFLCYDEDLTVKLGLILKSSDDFKIIASKYKNIVYSILSSIPKKNSIIDTFNYIFTPICSKLSSSEQSHYFSLIDGFDNDLISQSEISTLLYSWALRYDLKSIIDQSLFNPFPKNLLLDLIESKKEYSIL